MQCQARFVFATNRDLEHDIAEGRFREDLWFRINVVTCRVPPLRERPGEIEMLIRYYVSTSAKRMGLPVPEIADDVLELARHDEWRGNVRELINRVERAVALCEGFVIGTEDFWPDRQSKETVDTDGQATLAQIRKQAERDHIEKTLQIVDRRVQDAAHRLGISRTTLWEKMRKYGIADRNTD